MERNTQLECYNPVAAYAGVLFLEELLSHVHDHLVVTYHPDRNLSPNSSTLEFMLEGCATTIERTLAAAEARVEGGPWPELLYSSAQGGAVQVRLHGSNPDLYDSALDSFPESNPESHYVRVLEHAFDAKSGKNALRKHRPNVVAINMATQEEFQAVRHLLSHRGMLPHGTPLPADLDAVVWAITGINEKLVIDPTRCVWATPSHPLRQVIEAL